MKALSSHLININQEVEKEQGFEIDISQEQKDDSLKKALLNFIHGIIFLLKILLFWQDRELH